MIGPSPYQSIRRNCNNPQSPPATHSGLDHLALEGAHETCLVLLLAVLGGGGGVERLWNAPVRAVIISVMFWLPSALRVASSRPDSSCWFTMKKKRKWGGGGQWGEI